MKALPSGDAAESDYFHKPLSPLLFEIGRNHPVRLNDKNEDDVHPRRHISEDAETIFLMLIPRIVVIALLTVLLLCFIHEDTFSKLNISVSTKILFSLLLIAAAGGTFLYIFIIRDASQEPFSFVESISVWPTELIRILAIMLSLNFWQISRRDLRENTVSINKEFFEKIGDPEVSAASRRPPSESHLSFAVRFKILLSRLSTLWKPKTWFSIFHKQLAAKREIDELWSDYRQWDNEEKRFPRVIVFLIFYFILCAFIINTFDPLESPIRGRLSSWIDFIIIFSVGTAFTGLTFYVLDVTRVCRQFINIVAKHETEWSNNAKYLKMSTFANVPLEEWLRIRLVAKRTAAVGKTNLLSFYHLLFDVYSAFSLFRQLGHAGRIDCRLCPKRGDCLEQRVYA